MRRDLAPLLSATQLSRKTLAVTLYQTGSPRDLLVGTGGLTTVDLTPFVQSASQNDTGVTLQLNHHNELDGANAPRAGKLLQVKVGGVVVFNGVITQTTAPKMLRGDSRLVTIVANSRDSSPWWRDVRRVSPVFGVGMDLGSMARSIASALGLASDEYALPNVAIYLAHDNAQLADVTAWDMLETILQPALAEPWIDALGRLKMVNRYLGREVDQQLTWDRVLSVTPGGSRRRLTTVRVKWLDSMLSKVTQQDQVIAQTQLTAGFFRPSSSADVYWSEDHKQRAELTRLVVKQSINDGLVHVGQEHYFVRSEFGGTVRANLDAFLPGLATVTLAGLLAASSTPDAVQVAPATGTGATIPTGRKAQQLLTNALLLIIMTIGHGVYEIWGTPYDYIHAVNEVEAYDDASQDWEENVEEIANDLVPNEGTASDLAVNELLFRAKASTSAASVVVADDLRMEKGDLLGLPDGRRFYVQSYSRNLARGSDAILTLNGFFA